MYGILFLGDVLLEGFHRVIINKALSEGRQPVVIQFVHISSSVEKHVDNIFVAISLQTEESQNMAKVVEFERLRGNFCQSNGEVFFI